jgi:hypothetical protein
MCISISQYYQNIDKRFQETERPLNLSGGIYIMAKGENFSVLFVLSSMLKIHQTLLYDCKFDVFYCVIRIGIFIDLKIPILSLGKI